MNLHSACVKSSYSRLYWPILSLGLFCCSSAKLNTASSIHLSNPEQGKLLLIGAVILETPTQAFADRELEVYIVGEVKESGEAVYRTYTVLPNSEGYFALENMPAGKYTLAGVRLGVNGELLIWNDHHVPNERWILKRHQEIPPYTGRHWDWEPRLDVYNFGYNVFVWVGWSGSTANIHYYNRSRIEEESFGFNRTFTRPLIEEYLLEKFPGSGWASILKQLVSKLD